MLKTDRFFNATKSNFNKTQGGGPFYKQKLSKTRQKNDQNSTTLLSNRNKLEKMNQTQLQSFIKESETKMNDLKK